MPRKDGLISRLQEAASERMRDAVGMEVVDTDRLNLLESVEGDYSALRRELDLLGWSVQDYLSGNPQELNASSRRKFAQQARTVWMQDPQAGASVDLLNDFVFGRGAPRPTAKDPEVQKVIDEAWDDPDNQLALTSYTAQVALGTDLALQSNAFLLMFDDGDDGKVKLGVLDHDTVDAAVRDPDNRLRVLYYVAKERKQEWDFEHDRPKLDLSGTKARTFYYEHWRNIQQLEEQGVTHDKPPRGKIGKGRVYHLAVNRTSEMVFGVPTMRRTLRWYSALNDLMKARVDIAQAAAAFIMKRKVKGNANQLARQAAKALSREGPLGSIDMPEESSGYNQYGPRPGAIINENEGVEHQPFTVPTGSGDATADAQGIRGQISAATRFPQHYLGDASTSNLATATALELPVLKAIEARQEVFEGAIRWFVDRVIEKAVDDGNLDTDVTPDAAAADASTIGTPQTSPQDNTGPFGPQEAHEDKVGDEQSTKRDLSYEFSMPSPLRRMMTDLTNSVATVARTFDPNGSNLNLSRALLTIVLGQGLEVQDPSDMTDEIFPPGYVDPMLAAAQAQQQQQAQPPPDTGQFGPATDQTGNGQGGPLPTDVAANPYSAKQQSQPPERVMQQAFAPTGRFGQPLTETRYEDLPETLRVRSGVNRNEAEDQFQRDVMDVAEQHLARLALASNGHRES